MSQFYTTITHNCGSMKLLKACEWTGVPHVLFSLILLCEVFVVSTKCAILFLILPLPILCNGEFSCFGTLCHLHAYWPTRIFAFSQICWLRPCATSQKVAGSISDGVIGILSYTYNVHLYPFGFLLLFFCFFVSCF